VIAASLNGAFLMTCPCTWQAKAINAIKQHSFPWFTAINVISGFPDDNSG
jgi:hypothetical protein